MGNRLKVFLDCSSVWLNCYLKTSAGCDPFDREGNTVPKRKSREKRDF